MDSIKSQLEDYYRSIYKYKATDKITKSIKGLETYINKKDKNKYPRHFRGCRSFSWIPSELLNRFKYISLSPDKSLVITDNILDDLNRSKNELIVTYLEYLVESKVKRLSSPTSFIKYLILKDDVNDFDPDQFEAYKSNIKSNGVTSMMFNHTNAYYLVKSYWKELFLSDDKFKSKASKAYLRELDKIKNSTYESAVYLIKYYPMKFFEYINITCDGKPLETLNDVDEVGYQNSSRSLDTEYRWYVDIIKKYLDTLTEKLPVMEQFSILKSISEINIKSKYLSSRHSDVVSSSFFTYYDYDVILESNISCWRSVQTKTDYYSGGW